MFTGIIEELGKIKNISQGGISAVLEVEAKKVLEDTKIGDSIAVNGVCLTVTSMTSHSFKADVMAETLRKSSLGELKRGSCVNLERAMIANGRFGGHIVSGHIDGTGVIRSRQKEGNAVWVEIATGATIQKYIVQKGSIAIDGISLTVARLTEDSFFVSVIPHTGEETTLLKKDTGETVNLENDIIGKYVERLLTGPVQERKEAEDKTSGITMDFLREHGF